MNVVILDDEITTLKHHEQQVLNMSEWNVVKTFHKPSEFLNEFGNLDFDLLLCDIELPSITGLEVAQKVKHVFPNVLVVFLTAYSHYAIEAFRVDAVDYLLKPIKQMDLLQLKDKLQRYIAPKKPIKHQFDVSNFNSFDITIQGSKIKWPTQKSKELAMYFLFHQNQYIQKNDVIKSMWDDLMYTQEDTHFHMALYRLRKVIKTEQIDIEIHSQPGSKEGYMVKSSLIMEYDIVMALLQKALTSILTNEEFDLLRVSCSTPLLWEYQTEWIKLKRERLRIALIKTFENEIDYKRKCMIAEMIMLTTLHHQLNLSQFIPKFIELNKTLAQQTWLRCHEMLSSKFIPINECLVPYIQVLSEQT